MKTLASASFLALALIPGGALAQADAKQQDCQFLERSFQEVYDGLRGQQRGQGQGQAVMEQAAAQKPELVTMFVGIQQNIILMHTARGCDAGRLVALAREEAQRYGAGR